MLALIEREAIKKVLASGVSYAVAWAMSHVNGHFGISVDPHVLTVSIFAGIEVVRQTVVVKYPEVAPWLG